MQVLQMLRSVNGHAHVIIVTAHGPLESSDAFRAGAIDYIRKPFDINEFYQQVDAAILCRRERVPSAQPK